MERHNDFKDQGWVKIYRQSLNSSVWKNSVVWMVWSWCLLKANHGDIKFPFNGSDIELKSGQFITGQSKAIKEIPISAQMWRTAITYLKSTSRITIKSTNKFSIITVINWEQYQTDDRELTSKNGHHLTNQQQTSNKPATTYKNDKNVKNDKNKTIGEAKASPKVEENKPTAPSPLEPIPEWKWQEYLDGMEKSKRRDIEIIGYFFKKKGISFENKKQAEAGIRRWLKVASLLKAFSDDQLTKATKKAIEQHPDIWTLETIYKKLCS